MTQPTSQAAKLAELNSLFLTLNEKGQQSALTILRSLEFAQSVLGESDDEGDSQRAPDSQRPSKKQPR